MRLERMDLPPIQPESGELMFSGMIALRRVFWSLGAGAVCRPQMVDGLAARAFDFKVQRRSLAKQFATISTPDFVALHFLCVLFALAQGNAPCYQNARP